MSKNPLLHTLLVLSGQQNVITIHRATVEFLGSLEAAMMLEQLLYWTPHSVMNGWVAKSNKEWRHELCLADYSVRAATQLLKDMTLVEVLKKTFNGIPTLHYKINFDELEKQWSEWIEAGCPDYTDHLLKSTNAFVEINKSLTETTSETTSSFSGEKDSPLQPVDPNTVQNEMPPKPRRVKIEKPKPVKKNATGWPKSVDGYLEAFSELMGVAAPTDNVRRYWALGTKRGEEVVYGLSDFVRNGITIEEMTEAFRKVTRERKITITRPHTIYGTALSIHRAKEKQREQHQEPPAPEYEAGYEAVKRLRARQRQDAERRRIERNAHKT